MKERLLFAVASFAMSFYGFDQDLAADDVAPARDAPVALAPLLRFSAAGDIVVPVVFHNSSDKTVSYVFYFPDENKVALLKLSLYRNGIFQQPRVTDVPPPIAKWVVRPLAPGKSLVDRVKLSNTYGKLRPGTYELRARYDVGEHSWMVKELGLTPMSFQRTIAFLEIE